MNENDSYAGLLMVFRTYDAMKKSAPSFRIDEIEKQMEMDARGELRQYLADIESKK